MSAAIDMKLEIDIIPVSDVDRAKGFYERLGWRLDDDVAPMDGLRIVQFTPPGFGASITFGLGLTTAEPGSAGGGLVVSDIEVAHAELVVRGIEVSDIWHGPPFPIEARQPGPDPERASYGSFCAFTDPDGNTWVVQEVTSSSSSSSSKFPKERRSPKSKNGRGPSRLLQPSWRMRGISSGCGDRRQPAVDAQPSAYTAPTARLNSTLCSPICRSPTGCVSR